ncbi:MAG: 50S ribosomal protein L24 [Gammaproteobacteria bacterium]|jgi:large subunit ribosomal protein L24|nr:50S ribosomal protein L24 [Gammaproteobacteria bacterium]MBK6581442.1 50S ribosomal protein L24 [Gammaproteobacteria bacterium]MBK7167747.1 50S ribosomal protein L24 [Gammaproteobacteria bacterium]MBK7518608.1 50S ribosomal protein L24 [Gammaproteobacteria bacterium]MBK7727002.1 50S ribosomal protein L24 [Gammaproteobacteria bacterium]
MGKIKRDDDVVVITGRDKGKRGKIVRVLDNDRVIVSGINMIKRHTKANPQLGTAGGILEKEASMHVSNVGLVNPVTGKADRVGYKVLEDKTKVRVFRSTGEVIDG